MRYLSFGGGVDTMAMLVLMVEGKIEPCPILFCNVGEDSENPATIEYVHNVAMPYAAKHGIDFIELFKKRRDGSTDTIRQWVMRPNRTIGIPVRMANGAPGNRSCTGQFKIQVCANYARKNGARAKWPATMLVGIAYDELSRAKTDSGISYIRVEYPLIDLRLTRQDCINIIKRSGNPLPERSACSFCPLKTLAEWQEMRHTRPVMFWQEVDFERAINVKRARLGKDRVYLTGAGKPLDKATSDIQQLSLWPEKQRAEGNYSCGVFACSAA